MHRHSLLYVCERGNEPVKLLLVPAREAERDIRCRTRFILCGEEDFYCAVWHEDVNKALRLFDGTSRGVSYYVVYEDDGSWQSGRFAGMSEMESFYQSEACKFNYEEQKTNHKEDTQMANITFDRETKVTIATNLRSLREERNLTTASLAKKIGVCVDSIKNWEAATNIPSLENMIALGKFYSKDPRKLFGELVVKRAAQIAEARTGVKPELPTIEDEPTPQPAELFKIEPRSSSDKNLLGFKESVVQDLICAARKSSDPAVKKLADMLDMIDAYEGGNAA